MASIVKTLVAGNAAGRSSTGVPAIDWPNVDVFSLTSGGAEIAFDPGVYILQATTDVEFGIAGNAMPDLGGSPFRVRAGADFLLYVPEAGSYEFTASSDISIAVYPLETH